MNKGKKGIFMTHHAARKENRNRRVFRGEKKSDPREFVRKKTARKRRRRAAGIFLTAFCLALLLAALTAGSGLFAAGTGNAKNDYRFDGVHITRESLTVRVGGSFTLTLRKINAGSAEEVWESADPAIATVEGGEVFGVKAGKTTVTVKKGEFSDTIPVTVTESDPVLDEYAHTGELLRDFLDLRFGMFLHFNSSTYEFADIGGDWAGENRASTFDPADWNPSEIDCRDWAKAAKSAGMTFAVLTTKHHDGFNLWDSAYTDYDVGSAAYKEDIVKLFTDACREEGIKPGLYFSMLDIKHKITSSSCTANDVEFIKAQIRELVTGYGEIPFLIFDAWNAYWGGPNYTPLPYEEIVNLVHTYQPNCLVINISCEANSVRSQVAMFESAAGQAVPDWFDNVNVSCNTPTSHWFWCTKYKTETFKDADWVINENLHRFRDSDTVFILNVSPDQKGRLIDKYKTLLSEIGERYRKEADVEELPVRYLSDYDYTKNLLFRKVTSTSSADGNAAADRAVDGFTDYLFSHETASKTTSGNAFWAGDIGYTEKCGRLFVHVSSDASKAALDRTWVFLLKEDPGRTTYAKLDKGDYVSKQKLTDGSLTENCYALDFEGAEGRYLVIAVEGAGGLSLSEVILNAASDSGTADAAWSLRDKFTPVSVTLGAEPNLPEDALFVTKNGGLVRETIDWDLGSAELSRVGTVVVTGKSESGCEVSVTLRISSAGLYTEVPSVGVQASSMWSQAESLGWAHVRNLIDKSGLTLNSTNLLYSTHDNPYNGTTMWHTLEGNTTGWLIFDFGKLSRVTNALIWNHNQLDEADRGVRRMTVYYTDKEAPGDADWILIDSYTLTRAEASAAQSATDLISFGAVDARKIKLELTENYGDPSVIGLSEVIFLADKSGGTFDFSSLNTAIGAFEMLSRFDYDSALWQAADEAYRKAVTGRGTVKSQSEADALAEALNEKIEAMKKTYAKKTPLSLSFVIRTEAGKALPETVTVTFSDRTTAEAEVIWDAAEKEKLTLPGSFTLNGTLAGTPYTIMASVVVEGLSDASLRHLVSLYGALDTEGCTASSVSALQSALEAAKAVLNDSSRTQESVDAAKAALTAARYALAVDYAAADGPGEEKPEDPAESDAPGTTDTPNPPDTSAPSPDGTSSPSAGEKGENTKLGLWIGLSIGVLVLAAAAVLTAVVLKKRKK